MLTDDTESALQRMLGDPATCPHGNPLPGAPQMQADTVRLGDLTQGAVCRIVRIAERLEVEPGMLEAFERAGVIPGVQVAVEHVDDEGALTVRGPRRQLTLSAAAALDVFVVEGDLAAISDAVARPAGFERR